jgi:peptidoglycan/LPS O-acetylase OafA/YrhL
MSEIHGLSKNIAYIPALHHLRGLAAMLVFAHHYVHYYHFRWTAHPELAWLAPIMEGYTGVGLFFALSGYLFTTIALNSEGELHYLGFVRNRVLRILPLYTFVFVVALSLQTEGLHGVALLDYFVSNAGSPVSASLITGAAWTISIEFAFYMIFPFLIRFARHDGPRVLWRLIALLLVVKLGIFLQVERPDFALYSGLAGRMDQFLIGMLAALWPQRHRDWLQSRRWPLPAAAAATYAGLVWLARTASIFGPARHPLWLVWPTLEAALWSAVIVTYVARPPRWPARADAFLQRAGEISYSLYMLHALAIYVLFHTVGLMRVTGDLALDLVINAIPVGVLGWWLARTGFEVIERPFLRLRGRYLG